MGVMTLGDFRTDLQSALGDKGLPDPRLDRWINAAYLDLAGSIDFETLESTSAPATVLGVQTVAVPANAAIIKLVKDTTTDALLGWIPKAEMYRRQITPTGVPKYWTRHDETLLLHPVPSGVFNLLIVYKTMPAIMAASSDVTVFTSTWDAALHFLAVSHGLFALGEEERAMAFFGRAISYIQSRMTEQDMHAGASGLGASLPGTLQNLMQRIQLQAAANQGQVPV